MVATHPEPSEMCLTVFGADFSRYNGFRLLACNTWPVCFVDQRGDLLPRVMHATKTTIKARIQMGKILKQITYSLIGTLLGIGLVAGIAAEWADQKINQVSRMLDQKIQHVEAAPARAANNAWQSIKQAASDLW